MLSDAGHHDNQKPNGKQNVEFTVRVQRKGPAVVVCSFHWVNFAGKFPFEAFSRTE
jgi:hypothetical protein